MDARTAELEAAILADPDDGREGYLVLADHLQQVGDPRGELTAVQLARELAPDDPALAARERELLAAHEPAWLELLVGTLTYPLPRSIETKWRRGYLDAAIVPSTYESEDAAQALAQLADRSAARLLRELTVGVACSHHGRADADDTSVLEVLRQRPFPRLRSLALSALDNQLSWTHLGDVSIANPGLAELVELEIVAGRCALGAIELPRLRSLRIVTGGLRAEVLASLAAARWPALERLVVFLGTEEYGGTCTPADVEPILDGEALPHVTALGLCNSTFSDELAEQVARSRILPRLRRLDLSMGTLGEAGARAILAQAAAFAHLDELDLRDSFIPLDLHAALAGVCRGVRLDAPKVDDGWGRFVSVSE